MKAADDADFIKNRIEELKKEREIKNEQRNHVSGEVSRDYPNVPRGECYYCRENKTPCDGSCEFLGYLNYFKPVGTLQANKYISQKELDKIIKTFNDALSDANKP